MTELTEKARSTAMTILAINNFLTPVMTQAYTPMVPLYGVRTLGISVNVVGFVFGVLTGASVASFAVMGKALKHMPVHRLLQYDYAVRIVSGIVYLWSIYASLSIKVTSERADGFLPNTSLALVLLFVSRFLYGLTLNSFGVSSIWAGARMPEPAKSVGFLNMLVALGVTTGAALSSTLAQIFEDERMMYATPGLLTILLGAFVFALIECMDDGGMLPQAPPPAAGGATAVLSAEAKEKQRIVGVVVTAVCINVFAVCVSGLSGFEALMPLVFYDGYGLDAHGQLPLWLVFSGVAIVVNLSIPTLIENLNWARFVTLSYLGVALSCVPVRYDALTVAAPIHLVYVGLVGTIISGTAYVCHLSLLAERVPKELQVKYGSMAQSVGQIGRAVGPVLATQWYGFMQYTLPGSGPTSAWILMAGIMSMAFVFAAKDFTTIYGKCGAPSKRQLKAEAAKGLV